MHLPLSINSKLPRRRLPVASSCIYEGLIRHRRNDPVHHQFDFRSFLLMIDLDEVDSVFESFWLWSTDSFSFARFNADEHLKEFLPITDLRGRVDAVLEQNDFQVEVGPVKILTQLSYLGFAMNPISIFYCYDLAGEQVVAVIAEVNNTPWGEQHLYFIPSEDRTCERESEPKKRSTLFSGEIAKSFHVSPFMPLNMSYRMAFSHPTDRLAVKIENYSNANCDSQSKRMLDVSMVMKRKPMTRWNLSLMLIKFPLISFRIFGGIYLNALRLYLKKVPFFPHPGKSSSDQASNSDQELNPDSLRPATSESQVTATGHHVPPAACHESASPTKKSSNKEKILVNR